MAIGASVTKLLAVKFRSFCTLISNSLQVKVMEIWIDTHRTSCKLDEGIMLIFMSEKKKSAINCVEGCTTLLALCEGNIPVLDNAESVPYYDVIIDMGFPWCQPKPIIDQTADQTITFCVSIPIMSDNTQVYLKRNTLWRHLSVTLCD